MVAIGLVLLFLLAQATDNQALYERNYQILFRVNVAVALMLFAVILWVAIKLLVRLRRGRFGSRLLVKIAATFALVGLAPGLLIYVVSYQFVSRSIESWFDVKVEGALNAGVSLGTATLDSLNTEAEIKTRTATAQLAGVPDGAAGLVLERIREQLSASDAILWNSSGRLIASVGQSRFQFTPERPSSQLLREIRQARAIVRIEGLEDTTNIQAVENAFIKAMVLVGNSGVALNDEVRYLQVTLPLPRALVANAIAVQDAHREYQERALAQGGLRQMYIGTLTLALFLAVFGAVLLAVLLGNQLARPLLVLADGVAQVAAGDLSPKAALGGKDELGGLTRSFADMTQQLADARGSVEQSMDQVSSARANLQTILDNLTAGVIVLNDEGTVLSFNPGATRILRVPLAAYEGQLLIKVPGLEGFAAGVQNQFDAFLSDRRQHSLDHWQQSFELHSTPFGATQHATSIVARGAELPGTERLLVFDDISEIVSAQRAQAWGEVARRLAHEIKNPLTPIQLSAERMEMKLSAKLQGADQALLVKSVKTIVDQVDAMKRLVNEFRDYARLPAAELKPVDLNVLIGEILQLYSAENATVPVLFDADPACPYIMGDAQQLRQVVHNLLQNAQDASETRALAGTNLSPDTQRTASDADNKPVVVHTRFNAASQRVRLTVLDNGPGFAENILKRAFEPYVTTKTKGTGLGLAVVKKIADEHAARIDLSNCIVDGKTVGAQVSLSFATEPPVVV